MLDRIDGYAANAAYRYFPITEVQKHTNYEWTRNVKFWTLTLHTTTCRFAKFDRNGQVVFDYPSRDGLLSLASHGIGAPTNVGQGAVWLGCKTCGTANLSKTEWQRKAQQAIDADRAAEAARYAARRVQQQIEDAQDARRFAVRDARNRWIAAHEAEIAAVERAAAEQWDADNADLLAQIGEKEQRS